jgi:hypothetical protein
MYEIYYKYIDETFVQIAKFTDKELFERVKKHLEGEEELEFMQCAITRKDAFIFLVA